MAGSGTVTTGLAGAGVAGGAGLVGVEGAYIEFVAKNPINREISREVFAKIGPGVEFPAIENRNLSGFIIGPADVDVSGATIAIRYRLTGAFTFEMSSFNGYQFEFIPSGKPLLPIKGVSVDPSSTADLLATKLAFDADTVTADVGGLVIGPESKLIIALQFGNAVDSARPFSGSWKGSLLQGTKTFGFEMGLVQGPSSVTGRSRIDDGRSPDYYTIPDYAIMSLVGTVSGAALTFSEGGIFEQR